MNEKEFLQKIGFEIRIARTRNGMSGQELAELSGMKLATLYGIERGKRNSRILNYRRITDTLCIDLVSIFQTAESEK